MVGRSAPLDRNATPLLLDDGRYSLLAAAAAAVAITSVNPAIIGGARRSFGTDRWQTPDASRGDELATAPARAGPRRAVS